MKFEPILLFVPAVHASFMALKKICNICMFPTHHSLCYILYVFKNIQVTTSSERLLCLKQLASYGNVSRTRPFLTPTPSTWSSVWNIVGAQ